MRASIENPLSKYLAFGSFLTTVIVIAGPVSDPVNVPKFLILGITAIGISCIFFTKSFLKNIKRHKSLVGLLFLFFIASLNALLFSDAPLTQNLYGVYGRNTGFLTYLFFLILLLISAQFDSIKSVNRVLMGLLLAGLINIVYGLFATFFYDPIPWQNVYGAILGTFGNPNFSGSFYGIMAGVIFAYILNKDLSYKFRFALALFFVGNLYCVYLTDSTQGLLVLAISTSIVTWYFLFTNFKFRKFSYIFLFSFLTAGIIAVLGMLQQGPLKYYLYKRSVSLRGVYWEAAMQTGVANPFSGVGFDAFGDWYRRSRSLKAATTFPGQGVITNAAHNYFLDMFATGGIPLLISYLAITFFGLFMIIKILKRSRKFDPTFAILFMLYVGYQAQSIISIPQIGLAIWGWLDIGLLYSYQFISASKSVPQTNKSKQNEFSLANVGVFAFSLIGLLVVLPPFTADAKWSSALKSTQLPKVESALTQTYFTPSDSFRLANAALILSKSGLDEKAFNYVKQGIAYNKDFYDAWRLMYLSDLSSVKEKALALSNLKRLDPKNPEWKRI